MSGCPSAVESRGHHDYAEWRSRNGKHSYQRTMIAPRRHNAAANYVLDYLAHSFPVQLYEPFTDSEGNLSSRPVVRDGQPVECREGRPPDATR